MLEISLCAVRRAGDRGDRHAAGDVGAGVGDELLGAVDHPLAVRRARRGCGCCRRPSPPRARSGRTRPALRPAHSSRQPLALLLVGAPQVDRHRAERGVRGHRDADRGVDARQLLDRERVGQRVGRRRRRTPRETGSPSARARPASRRSRRGSLRRGRAPRRPARPPARAKSRTVAEQPLLGAEVEVHGRLSLGRGCGQLDQQPHAAPVAPLPTYARLSWSQAVPAMSRWTHGLPSTNSSRNEAA